MTARDVSTGMPFRFVGSETIYIAMGNGWYNSPEGYTGGPWCEDHDKQKDVELVPTTIHSSSFLGLNAEEVLTSYDNMTRHATFRLTRTDGDRALARRALTDLGLEPTEVHAILRKKAMEWPQAF